MYLKTLYTAQFKEREEEVDFFPKGNNFFLDEVPTLSK